MTAPPHNARDCERASRLAASSALGADERAFLAQHTAACRGCQRDEHIARALRFDGDEPFDGLDELARRRAAQRAVDALATPSLSTQPRPPADNVRRWAFAAAAAAVLLGAIFVTFWKWGPREPTHEAERRAGAAAAEAAATAAVLATRGEVALDTVHAEAGTQWTPGLPLSTRDGDAAVELHPAIRLGCAAETRVVLATSSPDQIVVFLERGRVLVDVDPQRPHPDLQIATRDGEVTVRGTAFEVEIAEHTTVRVWRGTVALRDGTLGDRRVQGGQSARLGLPGDEGLSPEAQQAAATELSRLRMPGPRGAGGVYIDADASTALVTVDGMAAGRVPVGLLLPAGRHRVEVAAAGHVSVAEWIELDAGQQARRTYELGVASPPVRPEQREAVSDVLPRAAEPTTKHAREAAEPTEPSAELHRRRGPTAPPPGPEALLAKAQDLRVARDWPAAAAAYESLRDSYPDSPEARSAVVALGTLQLRHLGQPEAALRAFDAYLTRDPRGLLAEEAAWGRCLALRELGRDDDELSALADFIEQYPAAWSRQEAAKRLDALRGP